MRCLAGHVYPGRPLEIWFSERWQKVTWVIDETQVPSGRRFHVICEETNEFWLEYDPVADCWKVSAVSTTGT